MTTADSSELSERIATSLVEQKLAACVNIIPKIRSIYRWKNKVENAQEWLLVIKSKKSLAKKVEAAIKKQHTYSLPECIVIPIVDGSPDYLEWIGSTTK
jgi:periplasmic divalent cation tolerance protein